MRHPVSCSEWYSLVANDDGVPSARKTLSIACRFYPPPSQDADHDCDGTWSMFAQECS